MTSKPRDLDDAAVELLLRGVVPDERPELAALAALTEDVRRLGDSPGPMPSYALAALLEHGLDPAPAAAVVPATPRRGLGLTARAAAAATAAFVGLGTAAAAADVLPTTVQDSVSGVVEVVTPFDLPDSADNRSPSAPVVEERVTDARDGGVADRTAPPRAAAASARPTAPAGGPPSAPGQVGLDRANETPAQGHARTAAPVPTARPAAPGNRPTTAPGGGRSSHAASPGPAGKPSAAVPSAGARPSATSLPSQAAAGTAARELHAPDRATGPSRF